MADASERERGAVSLSDLPEPSVEATIPVGDLSVDGRNPNEMPPDVFDLLVDRIRERGWVGNAIITDTDGTIADGEHRWRAAMELGLDEVPVKQYDISDAERRALRQELNKIRGEHDDDRDRDEFDHLLSTDEDDAIRELIEATRDDADDLLDGLLDDDDADAPLGTAEFDEVDESIADDLDTAECPECGHEFHP